MVEVIINFYKGSAFLKSDKIDVGVVIRKGKDQHGGEIIRTAFQPDQ